MDWAETRKSSFKTAGLDPDLFFFIKDIDINVDGSEQKKATFS